MITVIKETLKEELNNGSGNIETVKIEKDNDTGEVTCETINTDELAYKIAGKIVSNKK